VLTAKQNDEVNDHPENMRLTGDPFKSSQIKIKKCFICNKSRTYK